MRHPTFEFSLPIFCLLAAVFAAGPAAAGDGKIHHNPLAVKDEYIVVLKDDTPFDRVPLIARSLAEAHGGQVERVWQHAIKGFFIRLPEQAATALSRDPDVDYVEENAQAFLSDRVPTYADPACDVQPCATPDNRLWHLDIIDQDTPVPSGNFGFCSSGTGVYVYVVDTGVMRAHREFNNDAAKVVNGYNASGDGAYFPASDPCHGFCPRGMTTARAWPRWLPAATLVWPEGRPSFRSRSFRSDTGQPRFFRETQGMR